MRMSNDDILKLIPNEQLPKLQELFKHKWPYAAHVYSFIEIWMNQKLERPNENYVSFYCPNGDFIDGTFIAVIEIDCYDVFIFTWDQSLSRLKKSLLETKRIDWTRNPDICALDRHYIQMLDEVVEEKRSTKIRIKVATHTWWCTKEQALQFQYNIPNDLYVDKLNPTHIPQIHSVWPHRTPDNMCYLLKLLELNKGIGLFLKHNNELAAWVIRNQFGGIGILQTDDKHKRKGYGTLITKIFAKMLAENVGCDLTGFIIDENTESRNMFKNIGFQPVSPICWCLF